MSEGSVSFQSLIGNRFRFFDFKVSFFQNICHSESFFENGVENEFMILTPGLSQAEKFTSLRFFVRSKLSIKFFVDESRISLIIEVTEENQVNFFV